MDDENPYRAPSEPPRRWRWWHYAFGCVGCLFFAWLSFVVLFTIFLHWAVED